MKKKVASLLVVVMLLLTLSACGDTSTEGKNSEFEAMTIGAFCLNWTSSPYSEWKAYLEEYVGPYYNIEFVFNTESSDAEGEKSFMEKMGASGAKGVISFTPMNLDNCLEISSQYQMKFVSGSILGYDLNDFSDEQLEAFVGCVGSGETYRVGSAYNLTMDILGRLDQDKPMIIKALGINPTAGLPPTAGPLLQMKGIEQAVEELKADGKNIEFEEVYPSGFSPADWTAAADNALASIGDSDNGALITASTVDYSTQAFVNANAAGRVLYAGFEGVSPGNEEYFKDGLITACAESGPPCSFPALSFIMLYNAITGEKFVDENGNPPVAEMLNPLIIDNYDTFKEILNNVYSNEGNTYYTTDLINKNLKIMNEEASLETFIELVQDNMIGK